MVIQYYYCWIVPCSLYCTVQYYTVCVYRHSDTITVRLPKGLLQYLYTDEHMHGLPDMRSCAVDAETSARQYF